MGLTFDDRQRIRRARSDDARRKARGHGGHHSDKLERSEKALARMVTESETARRRRRQKEQAS